MTEREKKIRARLAHEAANRAGHTGMTSQYLDDMRYLLDDVDRLRLEVGKMRDAVDMTRAVR